MGVLGRRQHGPAPRQHAGRQPWPWCETDAPSDCDTEDPVNRYVDGQIFLYIWDRPSGEFRWFRDRDREAEHGSGFGLNPATLVDELEPAGGFEEVGSEAVDGVETTRHRATDPERTPAPAIDGVNGDTVTSLEVWVDPDGVVRRLDLATTEKHPEPMSPELAAECPDCVDRVVESFSMSIRFFDLGAPITIDAPTDYEDLGITVDPS